MKNEKNVKMSKQDLAQVQVVELGKILFNIQLVMALIVASPLPFAIYPAYYAALIVASVFTGFTIFLAYPGFASLWKPVKLHSVITTVTGAWKYTIPIVVAISLLAIFCLRYDKNIKHTKRIIASVIVILAVIIYFIFRISILKSGGAN